jgi:hypothetical protein
MNPTEITSENLNIGEIYFDKLKNKSIGKLTNKIIIDYDNKSGEKKPYYKLIFQKEENTTITIIRDYDAVFFRQI